MAAPARHPKSNRPAPRRRATLWEALAVFGVVGVVAYVVLGTSPQAASKAGQDAEPFSPMALVPEHMKPVDHHFTGCNQARAMGMTDIPAWHPSYRPSMDGDHDGFACEPYYGE